MTLGDPAFILPPEALPGPQREAGRHIHLTLPAEGEARKRSHLKPTWSVPSSLTKTRSQGKPCGQRAQPRCGGGNAQLQPSLALDTGEEKHPVPCPSGLPVSLTVRRLGPTREAEEHRCGSRPRSTGSQRAERRRQRPWPGLSGR